MRRARRPLGRRVVRLLAVGFGLLLLLVALTLGTAVMSAMGALRALQARGTEPAAARLLAGMTDQQTGLLDYVDSARTDPLVLYRVGQRETQTALGELRADAAGTAEAGAEARVESATRTWERWAEGMRQRVAGTSSPVADPVAMNEGIRLFGTFRSAQEGLMDELGADSSRAGDWTNAAEWAKVLVVVGGAASLGTVLLLAARTFVHQALGPLRELAETAEQVGAQRHTSIPHLDGGDEVGELARALQSWRELSATRTIVSEQAALGICCIDGAGRLRSVNGVLQAMLGYSGEQLLGQPFWAFMHPDDRPGAKEGHYRLMAGLAASHKVENRWYRINGSVVWCSMIAAPVLGGHGRPEELMGVLEDVTGRKLEAERAAQIQRDLLPRERPRLEGYELAGACLPAHDVGGDFYDWVGPQNGRLDLTVADVVGKGVGSALVMATLRAALRGAPHELGPAARVGLASESMARGLTDDGLFVTLFHARLDLGTGVLRYVNAGHGYAAVLRAKQAVQLWSQSLPVGVMSETVYREQQVQLRPGDTLLVYTGGLVEVGGRRLQLQQLARALEGAEDADQMVDRLLDRVRSQRSDDVTVVALRRAGELLVGARQASPSTTAFSDRGTGPSRR